MQNNLTRWTELYIFLLRFKLKKWISYSILHLLFICPHWLQQWEGIMKTDAVYSWKKKKKKKKREAVFCLYRIRFQQLKFLGDLDPKFLLKAMLLNPINNEHPETSFHPTYIVQQLDQLANNFSLFQNFSKKWTFLCKVGGFWGIKCIIHWKECELQALW